MIIPLPFCFRPSSSSSSPIYVHTYRAHAEMRKAAERKQAKDLEALKLNCQGPDLTQVRGGASCVLCCSDDLMMM